MKPSFQNIKNLTGQIATKADTACQEARNLLSTAERHPDKKDILRYAANHAIDTLLSMEALAGQLGVLLDQIPDDKIPANPTAAKSPAARPPPDQTSIDIGDELQTRLGPTDVPVLRKFQRVHPRTSTPD